MADILDRVTQILSDQGLDDKKIAYIENKLREEYSGSPIYIPKKLLCSNNNLMRNIRTRKDFQAIAKEFNVSISSVYRLCRISRKEK